MEIIYKNRSRKRTITEQQAISFGEYNKIFIENGNVTREEYYDNNVLDTITHYLLPTDIELEIVQELSPLVEYFVRISEPKTPLGTFFAANERTYKNEQLIIDSRILFDALGNVLCIERKDLNTGQPIYEKTSKFYYGTEPVENDSSLWRADYNSDGSLEEIDWPDPYDPDDSRVYDTDNFSELQERFTEDISYYLTATFEPS